MKKYTCFISLGYFCEVAQNLEKMGLRSFSSPFDWGISCFPNVIDAIDKGFDGFMLYDNLLQDPNNRAHYYDCRYNFWSFHDFSAYKSLEEQYEMVFRKYRRRIDRFLSAIKSPTLFIRYVSSEQTDENGKSIELQWIEENYQRILNVLKRYNPQNDIVFIGDETIMTDIVRVYHVQKDEADTVSRNPIINNIELYPVLESIDFDGKEANKIRYEKKNRKKRAFGTRLKNKALHLYERKFKEPYIHTRVVK